MALSNNSGGLLGRLTGGGVHSDMADSIGQAIQSHAHGSQDSFFAPPGGGESPPVPRAHRLAPDMDEYPAEEIGEYFRRFDEYGLLPSVAPSGNTVGWVVTLTSGSDGEFAMTIRGDTLVGTLQQADMAAGGWHAQREIERTLRDEQMRSARDAAMGGMTASKLMEMQKMCDSADVPSWDRQMVIGEHHMRKLNELMEQHHDNVTRRYMVDRMAMSTQPQMVVSPPESILKDSSSEL